MPDDLLDDIPLPAQLAVDMRMPYTLILNLTPEEKVAVDQLSVLMKMDPIHVVHDLIHRATPSPNGSHGYDVLCSGCGRPYIAKRRPLPNKKRWCPDCRATGEPAADRARTYRDRKSKETA